MVQMSKNDKFGNCMLNKQKHLSVFTLHLTLFATSNFPNVIKGFVLLMSIISHNMC